MQFYNLETSTLLRAINDSTYYKEHLVKDNPDCIKALDYVISELKKKIR